MWDFFETVRHRHSVRKYRAGGAIEREKLHAVLEAACAAPSAGDLQSYRIYVVENAELRRRPAGGGRRGGGGAAGRRRGPARGPTAPACLVFCADTGRAAEQYGERGRALFALQDATIAAAYAQLAVVAAGLGSTWVGAFDAAEVARVLGLETGLQPIALLSVGYPAELPPPTPRRPLDEVVRHLP
ncbi:MAG: nitroreductase family protein [Gammaproteobacteria bacterium]|nr:nitroreductase family protein [Gammaproteobacteria bacterium]